jgi:membrane protease YdiL (CAAX protease family)
MRAFAWFLGLIVFGLAAMALLTYPAWLLLHPHFDFPFHRVGERIGMLALALGFVLCARRLRLADRTSLGYGIPRRLFLREAAIGLGLGVLTMAAVAAVMSALGLLDWSAAAGYGAAALGKLLGARLASGLAVAFIEETFLRGAMYSGIERESGAGAAVLLTAAVFSATHFFAGFKIPPDQVTAWSGLDLLGGTLRLLTHPLGVADAFLCLVAVGIVLGAVRAATGNIAACIGLHAGWVWVMLVVHALAQPLRSAPLSFLLSRFDGFVGWLVLAWTILLGVGLRRFYAGRAGCARGASRSSR